MKKLFEVSNEQEEPPPARKDDSGRYGREYIVCRGNLFARLGFIDLAFSRRSPVLTLSDYRRNH